MTDIGSVQTWDVRRSAFALAFLGGITLVVTLAANGLVGHILPPELRWIAGACIPSLLVAIALYLLVSPARPFKWAEPHTPWRKLLRVASNWLLVWLLASLLYAIALGRWPAYIQGMAYLLCFALVGPLVEELLFRGAVFELAQRTFRRSIVAPLAISTLLFSLYHLQLHHFRVSPFVATQLAFTLPMGWVFARLRSLSGSIWPGYVLHVLTNLPHCFGSAPASGF